MGKIGEKYCKKSISSITGKSRYHCNYRELSEGQLKELGLTKWGGMIHPYVSDVPNKDGCHHILFSVNCKEGELDIFHGTSYENTRKIVRSGFIPRTGVFGRGGYFTDSSHWRVSGNIEYQLPTNYARRHRRGSVVMGCLQEKFVKTYRDLWEEYDKDMLGKFGRLKGKVPDSVETFFNWNGYKYDTKEELYKGYEEVGRRVQEFALQHGIDAYKDNTQIIIYNEDILDQIKFKEVKECRTM